MTFDLQSGLDVATCGVANATGFGPLATNFSRAVARLATAISTYRKDWCISHTFLLKFWAKNRGCGLYTRQCFQIE